MAKPVAKSGSNEDVLLFEAAGDRLALPLAEVMEIIRPPVVTRVPNSSPNLLGVANLRGMVLPVVSLSGLLGSAHGEDTRATRVVVVQGKTPVGLLVDQVTALSTTADGRRLDLDGLLDKDFRALARRDHKSREALAQASAAPLEETLDELVFMVFGVAGQQYALPIDEIVNLGAIPEVVASLPRTDKAMIGVAELDGALVPLVSARVLLGFADDGENRQTGRIVLMRLGEGLLGLLVDELRQIIRVSARDIDPVPPVLTRGRAEAQVEAICRLDEGRRLISILASAKLFDADTVARIQAQATPGEDSMPTEDAATRDTEQFVVFRVGDEIYGLPIVSVDEVVRCPDTLARVPRAPKFVSGLMNLRGKAIPIIDQRQRFSVSGSEDCDRRRIVVVTIDGLQAGFLVDSVSEILSVSERDLSPAPELSADAAHVIDRVAMVERGGHMVLLVDPKALLDRAERDVLASLSDNGEAARTP